MAIHVLDMIVEFSVASEISQQQQSLFPTTHEWFAPGCHHFMITEL